MMTQICPICLHFCFHRLSINSLYFKYPHCLLLVLVVYINQVVEEIMEIVLFDLVEGIYYQKTPQSPLCSLRTHLLRTQRFNEFSPVDFLAKEFLFINKINVLNIVLCWRIVIFLESRDGSSTDYQPSFLLFTTRRGNFFTLYRLRNKFSYLLFHIFSLHLLQILVSLFLNLLGLAYFLFIHFIFLCGLFHCFCLSFLDFSWLFNSLFILNLNNLLTSHFFFLLNDIERALKVNSLKLLFQFIESTLPIFLIPKMQRHKPTTAFTVIFMEIVFERFQDETAFVSLLHFKTYCKFKRKVVLFDLTTRNQFDILTQNRFRHHRILSLHKSKSCVSHATVVVSVEVVVVFKEISQQKFSVVILEFVVDFKEVLLRMKDESFKSSLKVLKIRIVSESKLHHMTCIVYCLVFVQLIESFEIFTFFITNYRLLCFMIFVGSTQCHCLTVTAVTFHQDLSLTWEIFTFLARMAELRAEMFAV